MRRKKVKRTLLSVSAKLFLKLSCEGLQILQDECTMDDGMIFPGRRRRRRITRDMYWYDMLDVGPYVGNKFMYSIWI